MTDAFVSRILILFLTLDPREETDRRYGDDAVLGLEKAAKSDRILYSDSVFFCF